MLLLEVGVDVDGTPDVSAALWRSRCNIFVVGPRWICRRCWAAVLGVSAVSAFGSGFGLIGDGCVPSRVLLNTATSGGEFVCFVLT